MDAFVLDARVRGWWIGYAPRKWTGGSKADLRRRGIAAPGSGVAALWVASRRNTLNVSATIVPPSRPAPPPVLTVGRKATVLQHHCYDPSELRHLRPLRRQSRTPSSSSTTYMRVQDGVPKLPSPSDGNGRRSAPPQRRQTAQESPVLVAGQPSRVIKPKTNPCLRRSSTPHTPPGHGHGPLPPSPTDTNVAQKTPSS
jgi:hypothetical protein